MTTAKKQNTKNTPKTSSRDLRLEALESRQLLSVSPANVSTDNLIPAYTAPAQIDTEPQVTFFTENTGGGQDVEIAPLMEEETATLIKQNIVIETNGNYHYTTNNIKNAFSITVKKGVIANITLENVNLAPTDAAAISIIEGSTVNLTLVGENTLKGANVTKGNAWAGIHVEGEYQDVKDASQLIITAESTGSLTAIGGYRVDTYAKANGSGIGSNGNSMCGDIVINGGTIVAKDGGADAKVTRYEVGAAGIGNAGFTGGSVVECTGSITINGGNITAVGGMTAAAIGGDNMDITITGGTIQATATAISDRAMAGAAIGSSNNGSAGNISITGGKITAIGAGSGVGIGSGSGTSGNIGKIEISGKDTVVNATGGSYTSSGKDVGAAGIGLSVSSWMEPTTGGVIKITEEAQVIATAGDDADSDCAAIGTSSYGSGYDYGVGVTVSYDSTVKINNYQGESIAPNVDIGTKWETLTTDPNDTVTVTVKNPVKATTDANGVVTYTSTEEYYLKTEVILDEDTKGTITAKKGVEVAVGDTTYNVTSDYLTITVDDKGEQKIEGEATSYTQVRTNGKFRFVGVNLGTPVGDFYTIDGVRYSKDDVDTTHYRTIATALVGVEKNDTIIVGKDYKQDETLTISVSNLTIRGVAETKIKSITVSPGITFSMNNLTVTTLTSGDVTASTKNAKVTVEDNEFKVVSGMLSVTSGNANISGTGTVTNNSEDTVTLTSGTLTLANASKNVIVTGATVTVEGKGTLQYTKSADYADYTDGIQVNGSGEVTDLEKDEWVTVTSIEKGASLSFKDNTYDSTEGVTDDNIGGKVKFDDTEITIDQNSGASLTITNTDGNVTYEVTEETEGKPTAITITAGSATVSGDGSVTVDGENASATVAAGTSLGTLTVTSGSATVGGTVGTLTNATATNVELKNNATIKTLSKDSSVTIQKNATVTIDSKSFSAGTSSVTVKKTANGYELSNGAIVNYNGYTFTATSTNMTFNPSTSGISISISGDCTVADDTTGTTNNTAVAITITGGTTMINTDIGSSTVTGNSVSVTDSATVTTSNKIYGTASHSSSSLTSSFGEVTGSASVSAGSAKFETVGSANVSGGTGTFTSVTGNAKASDSGTMIINGTVGGGVSADTTGNVTVSDNVTDGVTITNVGTSSFSTVGGNVEVKGGTDTNTFEAITGTLNVSGGVKNNFSSVTSTVTISGGSSTNTFKGTVASVDVQNTATSSINNFNGKITGTLNLVAGTNNIGDSANDVVEGNVTISGGKNTFNAKVEKSDVANTVSISGGENTFNNTVGDTATADELTISGGTNTFNTNANVTAAVTIQTNTSTNNFDGTVTGNVTASAGTSTFSNSISKATGAAADSYAVTVQGGTVTFDGGTGVNYADTQITSGKLTVNASDATVTSLTATGGTTDINAGTVTTLNATNKDGMTLTATAQTVTTVNITQAVNTVYSSTTTSGKELEIGKNTDGTYYINHSDALATVNNTDHQTTVNSGTIEELSGNGAVIINGSTVADYISVGTTTTVGSAENGSDVSSTEFKANYTGNLTINGDAGDDKITVTAHPTSGTVTLNGNAGDDLIIGSAGKETINGGDSNDVIISGGGTDTINGDGGADLIIGGTYTNTYGADALWTDWKGNATRETAVKLYANNHITADTIGDEGTGASIKGGADNDVQFVKTVAGSEFEFQVQEEMDYKTIVVTTGISNSKDEITLNEAIEFAKAHSTITNIGFTSNVTTVAVYENLAEITTSLTIDGSGDYDKITSTKTTSDTATRVIDGTKNGTDTTNYTLFNIASNANVNMNNLTIQNSTAAINNAGTLNITGNVSVQNNSTTYAVVNTNTMTVNNGVTLTVSANTAGGISNTVDATGTGKGFTNNGILNVTGNSGANGINNAGTFAINGATTVSGNTDVYAIENSNTMTVNNDVTLTVDQNTAGGISNTADATGTGKGFTNNGTLNVTGNSVTTGNGAGINNVGTFTSSGTMTVSDNTANNNGGGIYNVGTFTSTGTLTVGESGKANKATDGAGIYNTGTLTLTGTNDKEVTISNNTANNNGGGIYNESTNMTLTNVEISNNEATNGGGLWNSGVVTANQSNLTISANKATTNGGGIYNEGTLNLAGENKISGSTDGDTTKEAVNGGGIYNSGTFTIVADSKTTISNNEATDGAGIYNASGKSFTNNGTLNITSNTATTNGAGIYNDGTLTLSGTANVSNNEAKNDGGGIYQNGTLTNGLDMNLMVTNNQAVNGAGVYVNKETTLKNGTTNTITGNVATGNGGGIYVANGATLNVTESSNLTTNKGTHGGGLYLDGTLTVADGKVLTFTNNNKDMTANNYGGALYIGAYATYGDTTNTFTIDKQADFVFTTNGTNDTTYGGAIYNAGKLDITANEYAFGANVTNVGTDSSREITANSEINYGIGAALYNNGTFTHASTYGTPFMAGSAEKTDSDDKKLSEKKFSLYITNQNGDAAIANGANGTMTLDNVKIFGNTGGGLRVDGGNVTLKNGSEIGVDPLSDAWTAYKYYTNSDFEANTTYGVKVIGGNFTVAPGQSVAQYWNAWKSEEAKKSKNDETGRYKKYEVIDTVRISGNTGTGVIVEGGTVNLNDVRMEDNETGMKISEADSNVKTIVNTANVLISDGATGINLTGGTTNLTHTTVAGNTTNQSGTATLNLYNSIVVGGTATSDNSNGNGTKSATDYNFTHDVLGNKYTLGAKSDAFNAGDNDDSKYTDGSTIVSDLAGHDRVLYQTVDLGAFENPVYWLTNQDHLEDYKNAVENCEEIDFGGAVKFDISCNGHTFKWENKENAEWIFVGKDTNVDARYLAEDDKYYWMDVKVDAGDTSGLFYVYKNGVTLNLYGQTIMNANSTQAGGALLVDTNSVANLYGMSFIDCHSNNFGGAIYGGRKAVINIYDYAASGYYDSDNEKQETTTYRTNTFSGNTAWMGGAIYSENTGEYLTINGVTYAKGLNITGIDLSGKTYMDENGKIQTGPQYDNATDKDTKAVKQYSAQFIDNMAGELGGAIYVSGRAGASINGATFINNKIPQNNVTGTYGGGAMYINSTVELNNADFLNNYSCASGGAIVINGHVKSDGNLVFAGNSTDITDRVGAGTHNGGAIYLNSGSLTLGNTNKVTSRTLYDGKNLKTTENTYGSEFLHNEAELGGAIETRQGTATITGAYFKGNLATAGAAMYNQSANVTISASQIEDNYASTYGGGLFGTFTATGTTVTKNWAYNGGGVWSNSASGATVTDNYATIKDAPRYNNAYNSSKPSDGVSTDEQIKTEDESRTVPTTDKYGIAGIDKIEAVTTSQLNASSSLLTTQSSVGSVNTFATPTYSVTEWDTIYAETRLDNTQVAVGDTVEQTLTFDPNVFQMNLGSLQVAEGWTCETTETTDENGKVSVKLNFTAQDTATVDKLVLANVELTPTGNGLEASTELLGVKVEKMVYDMNQDGKVNINDLVQFAREIGNTESLADFNNDGTVNINDLVLFARKFGATAPVAKPVAVAQSSAIAENVAETNTESSTLLQPTAAAPVVAEIPMVTSVPVNTQETELSTLNNAARTAELDMVSGAQSEAKTDAVLSENGTSENVYDSVFASMNDEEEDWLSDLCSDLDANNQKNILDDLFGQN